MPRRTWILAGAAVLGLAAAAEASGPRLAVSVGGGYDGNLSYARAPTEQIAAGYAEAAARAGWFVDAARYTAGVEVSGALRNYRGDDGDLGTSQRGGVDVAGAWYPRPWAKLGVAAGGERSAARGEAIPFLGYTAGFGRVEALWLGTASAFGAKVYAERARYDSYWAGDARRLDDRLTAAAVASVDAWGTWRFEPGLTWAPSNDAAVAYVGPEAWLGWRRPLWRGAALRLSGEGRYRRYTDASAARDERQWRGGAGLTQVFGDALEAEAGLARVVTDSDVDAYDYAWNTAWLRLTAMLDAAGP